MHSCEEVVHSEVCHHYTQESKRDVDVVDERLAEDGQALRMYNHSIYHKGNECPGLLAVPTPVGSPAYVRPDGTDEDTEAHGGKGRVEEDAAQSLEFFTVGAEANAHDAADEGEREQSIAHHDDAYVDAEQRTVEHRHHLSDGRVHLVDVTYQEEET